MPTRSELPDTAAPSSDVTSDKKIIAILEISPTVQEQQQGQGEPTEVIIEVCGATTNTDSGDELLLPRTTPLSLRPRVGTHSSHCMMMAAACFQSSKALADSEGSTDDDEVDGRISDCFSSCRSLQSEGRRAESALSHTSSSLHSIKPPSSVYTPPARKYLECKKDSDINNNTSLGGSSGSGTGRRMPSWSWPLNTTDDMQRHHSNNDIVMIEMNTTTTSKKKCKKDGDEDTTPLPYVAESMYVLQSHSVSPTATVHHEKEGQHPQDQEALPVLQHYDNNEEGQGGDAFSSSSCPSDHNNGVRSPTSSEKQQTTFPRMDSATRDNRRRPLPILISCVTTGSSISGSGGAFCYNHDVPPNILIISGGGSSEEAVRGSSPSLRDGKRGGINSPLHDCEEEHIRLFDNRTDTHSPQLVPFKPTQVKSFPNKDHVIFLKNEQHKKIHISQQQQRLRRGADGNGESELANNPPSSTTTSSASKGPGPGGQLSTSTSPAPAITSPPQVKRMTLVLGLVGVIAHELKSCKSRTSRDIPNRPPDAQLLITTQSGSVTKETINVYYRPHIAHFIGTVLKHFDIAIFSSGEQDYVDALLDVMDPSGQVFPKSRRYYRQHCTKVASDSSDVYTTHPATSLAKDLQLLDLPLSEVVLVDDTASSGFLQPNNLLLLPTWTGDPTDIVLLQLGNDLTRIATTN